MNFPASPSIGIVAIDHAAPPTVQTAEELAPMIGKTAQWIHEHAGVAERRVAQPGEDPTALVAELARPLIERQGQPDLLINAGGMVRQMVPDTSVFIGHHLELKGIPCFSINATCLSFVVAINTAKSLIMSGSASRVLVCSAEFPSRGRNFDQPESAALLGDGCAAAMIETETDHGVIEHFKMKTWPAGAHFAEVRGGGVMKRPWDETTTHADHVFDMKGEQLLRFVLPRLRPFLREFLDECGLDFSDIAAVVPHQASLPGMQIVAKLGFEDSHIINILNDHGNCVAASIPMALSHAAKTEQIKRGDRILLLGTAAGVSTGAAILRW